MSAMASECLIFLNTPSQEPIIDRAVQEVLSQFEFPKTTSVPISNLELRKAIYNAFGGRDFYTGQPISFEEMRIDHIVPKSKGGPDNIYNYVPTTSRINSRKNANFDPMAAVAILANVRTTYAPKVIIVYATAIRQNEAAKALRRAQAENRRQAQQQTRNNVKPAAGKVIGHEISFVQDDVKILESVIVLQRFVAENPDIVFENEIFISNESIELIRRNYPEFDIAYAFSFFARFYKVYENGSFKATSGSRFFGSMDSSAESVATIPEGTLNITININSEVRLTSAFQHELKELGGHILRVNQGWQSLFFDTKPIDFADLLRSGKVDRSTIVNPWKIKLEPLNATVINLLKLISKYSKKTNASNRQYEIDIQAAISDGYAELTLNLKELTSQFFGTLGRDKHLLLLKNAEVGRKSNGENILNDVLYFRFDMFDEMISWLQSVSFDELDRILNSRNIDLNVELPIEVTPTFYLR